MTKSQHTPTPWRVGDAGATVFAPKSHSPLMVAQRLKRDDAAFIVRACNAHDALVEALELAQDELSAIADYHACVSEEALDKISEALKLAKEG